MKKELKKLTLSKETLRLLNDLAPGKVLGGNGEVLGDKMDTASGCCGDSVTCTTCC